MIIDLTKTVIKAFLEVPEIVKWVAKVKRVPNISANKMPAKLFPAIGIFEVENLPEMYADDEEETSMIVFQISLLSEDSSHSKVQNHVDEKMKELGFTRIGRGVPIKYTDETDVTHRVLFYTQEVEHSEYT